MRRPYGRRAGAARRRGGPRRPVRPAGLPQARHPARRVRPASGHAPLARPGRQRVGTFTLTAQGGPVSYSISAAANLTVSPASGSLAAGASATITVTSSSLITLNEQLTVNPGGYTVTVVLNISL